MTSCGRAVEVEELGGGRARQDQLSARWAGIALLPTEMEVAYHWPPLCSTDRDPGRVSTDSISWLTWVTGDRSDVLDQRGVGEGLPWCGGLTLVEEALAGGEVGDAGHQGGQASAPMANVAVTRARRPRPPERRLRVEVASPCSARRRRIGGLGQVPADRTPAGVQPVHRSHRQLVAHAPDGEDEPGVGRVGLDLGAEPPHVDVDQPSVTEVVVPPDPVERCSRLSTLPGWSASSHSSRNSVRVQWTSTPSRRTTPCLGLDLHVSEAEDRVFGSSVGRDRLRRARIRAASSLATKGLVT